MRGATENEKYNAFHWRKFSRAWVHTSSGLRLDDLRRHRLFTGSSIVDGDHPELVITTFHQVAHHCLQLVRRNLTNLPQHKRVILNAHVHVHVHALPPLTLLWPTHLLPVGVLLLLFDDVALDGRASVVLWRRPLERHVVLVVVEHFRLAWSAGWVCRKDMTFYLIKHRYLVLFCRIFTPWIFGERLLLSDERLRLALAVDRLHAELVFPLRLQPSHSELRVALHLPHLHPLSGRRVHRLHFVVVDLHASVVLRRFPRQPTAVLEDVLDLEWAFRVGRSV